MDWNQISWHLLLRDFVSTAFQDSFISSHQGGGFVKISQNSQERTCAHVPESLLIKLQASIYNFIKNETLAQVFSCEFCQNFKNTLSTEKLPTTASVVL